MVSAPPPKLVLPLQAGLADLVAALGGGETTRLIGGAVRDSLLGLPVNDIDMATRLLPDAVIACLEAAQIKAVPTGIAHGTVTAVTAGGPVEVTTLRRDIETDGRHARVAFTDDWEADAARRDFTINALSANPETGAVHDYFGGIDDLAAGRVRFIGAPLARIAEDRLRILRFFRFHARFGKGAPDPAAYDACAARANDLMALSRERIAMELLKLLGTDGCADAIGLMVARDILKPVLPEITTSELLARLVMREATMGISGDPVRRLAALIGPDPALAHDIAMRLRFSKEQTRRLAAACGRTASSTALAAMAYRLGAIGAIDRLLLGDGNADDIAVLRSWEKPVFPIGGGALVARGLDQGPVVARTLSAIESAWIDSGFPDGDVFEALVTRAIQEAS
ncbi:MAG: CCA tRNA nucleotidyltransferase [Sphingomonadaceae bacterium]